MPTFVDWWQVKNFPGGGGGSSFDNDPSTGPYNPPTLFFRNAGGLHIISGNEVDTLLASLRQQGVLGTSGGQQIQGELFIVGAPELGIFPAPPAWSPDSWALTLQDGGLAFYDEFDGAIITPNAQLQYTNPGGSPFLHLLTAGDLEILGGQSAPCNLTVGNASIGSFLLLGNATGTTLSDPDGITLQSSGVGTNISAVLNSGTAVLTFSDPGGSGQGILDLTGTAAGTSYLSIDNTWLGQWGNDPVGNQFSGGLCTSISPSYSPTTIDGFPLSLSAPALNDVLTWDGANIIFQPGGGGGLAIGSPVTGGAATGVLYMDGSVDLAYSAQFLFDPTVGLGLFTNGNSCNLAPSGAGAIITRGGAQSYIASSGYAFYALSGNIYSLGTVGNTYWWGNSHSAPSTTQPVAAPVNAYGAGAILEYLGSPDEWLLVSYNGTDLLIPAYLP